MKEGLEDGDDAVEREEGGREVRGEWVERGRREAGRGRKRGTTNNPRVFPVPVLAWKVRRISESIG